MLQKNVMKSSAKSDIKNENRFLPMNLFEGLMNERLDLQNASSLKS